MHVAKCLQGWWKYSFSELYVCICLLGYPLGIPKDTENVSDIYIRLPWYIFQIYAVARTEMSTASYASTMSKQNMIDCKIDLRC